MVVPGETSARNTHESESESTHTDIANARIWWMRSVVDTRKLKGCAILKGTTVPSHLEFEHDLCGTIRLEELVHHGHDGPLSVNTKQQFTPTTS